MDACTTHSCSAAALRSAALTSLPLRAVFSICRRAQLRFYSVIGIPSGRTLSGPPLFFGSVAAVARRGAAYLPVFLGGVGTPVAS